MPSLFVDADPPSPVPLRFSTDPQPLLALLSFGLAEPFETQHPLTVLIRRMKQDHEIDVLPLLTFYDRDTEDAEDEAKLRSAWQPARGLRDCVAAVRVVLSRDAVSAALVSEAGVPSLPQLLAELESMASSTLTRSAGGGQVRISFSLEDEDLPDGRLEDGDLRIGRAGG